MSLALAYEHRQVLNSISAVAVSDTTQLLELAKDQPFPEWARAVRVGVPEIASQYGAVASFIAVEYYDLLRQEADNGNFEAYAATEEYDEAALLAEIEASTGYAIGQAKDNKFSSYEAAMAFITGAVILNVFNHSRENIKANGRRDKSGKGYVRVARLNACPFCKTHAAVDGSQVRSLPDGYHRSCRCVVAEEFEGSNISYNQPFTADYREAYALVAAQTSNYQDQMREMDKLFR